MTNCPNDESLTRLLSDELSAAERDALALHVEECLACQEKLAQLAANSDTEIWQRAGQTPQRTAAEDEVVRRLKRSRSGAAQFSPTVMGDFTQYGSAGPTDGD